MVIYLFHQITHLGKLLFNISMLVPQKGVSIINFGNKNEKMSVSEYEKMKSIYKSKEIREERKDVYFQDDNKYKNQSEKDDDSFFDNFLKSTFKEKSKKPTLYSSPELINIFNQNNANNQINLIPNINNDNDLISTIKSKSNYYSTLKTNNQTRTTSLQKDSSVVNENIFKTRGSFAKNFILSEPQNLLNSSKKVNKFELTSNKLTTSEQMRLLPKINRKDSKTSLPISTRTRERKASNNDWLYS